MKKVNQELIRVKKTKFVKMLYSVQDKELYMTTEGKMGAINSTTIPMNKIPQVIRGLFSCYQRFHKKGYRKPKESK